MDVSYPNNMTVSEGLCSSCQLFLDTSESANSGIGDSYINDLGGRFTELLNIRSEDKSTPINIPSLDDINNSAFKDDDSKDSSETELAKFTSDRQLAKCAIFPFTGKGKSTLCAEISEGEVGSKSDQEAENAMRNGDGQFSNSLCPSSISLPTPLKLVSAMKGSREKLGAPSTMLRVKWAPDVYDPLPTAESHLPNHRPQRHKSDKKNGKYKQRGSGKASRGIKGKDKKQSRKHAGSSNRCFKSLDNEDRATCYSEPQAKPEVAGLGVDFDVGSTDPFCGHSFLKKSVAQLHFPVAEAT